MNKKIISFFLTSLLISSCSINNLNISDKTVKKNYELRVDDGTISKRINVNFGSLFSIKDVSSGQLENDFSNVDHIKLIISKNPSAAFNDITVSVNTITTSTFTFTLNGLNANTKYYIAARAYSSSIENESTNITEGGTIVSNEYININNSGQLNIINDNANNKIDINIKLKNRVGVKIDTNSKISEGSLGSFSLSQPLLAINAITDTLYTPKTFVNNKGNGFILWHQNNASGNFIKGVKLKDYEVNSDPIFFSDNPPADASFTINDLSFETNDNGDGVVIWARKLDASNPEHIFYKEIRNNLPINTSDARLDSNSSIPDSDTLSKPLLKLSHDNTKVVSAWLTGDLSTKSEIGLRASNLNPSISWGSQTLSAFFPSSKVISFDISKADNLGNFLVVLLEDTFTGSKIKTLKFSIDGTLNITNTASIDITSNNSSNKSYPKVYLNDKGDGLIAWIEEVSGFYRVYCKRIFNFFPSTELIQLASSTTNIRSNLSIGLNINGNGIVSWIEGTSINMEKFSNFYPTSDNNIISLSSPENLNTYLNIDNKGIYVFKQTTKNIYYNRIFNNIPQ